MWMWAAVSVLALAVTYIERAEECDSLLMALSQKGPEFRHSYNHDLNKRATLPAHQLGRVSPDIHTLTSYW